MPDLTINVPFTVRAATEDEAPEVTGARLRQGLEAIAVHLSRAGRQWADLGTDDAARIAAAGALQTADLIEVTRAEIVAHIGNLIAAEIAYRAAEAARAAADAQAAQAGGLFA